MRTVRGTFPATAGGRRQLVHCPPVAGADKRQRKKDNARAAREAREAQLRKSKQRKTAMRIGVLVVLFAIVVAIFTILPDDDDDSNTSTSSTSSTVPASTTTTVAQPAPTTEEIVAGSTATATVETNFGPIVIALDTKYAPKGAQRFIDLAKEGLYDGLTWHRAVKDFVIQGGDPKGDGTGGKGDPVVAEVPTDNYPVGSLAAAKAGTDAAGTFDSQFFIVTGPNGATLPNDYARFGVVTEGIENAQKIEALAPETGDGAPTESATIDKITITEK
jgi:cyclophilin family peptidyl-prolyl cis-trans isomerase